MGGIIIAIARKGIGVIFGMAALFLTCSLSYANGGAFFQPESLTDHQFLYFGHVKDDRGNRVEGAVVTWTTEVQGQDGQHRLHSDATTDELGHYRTKDIAFVVAAQGYTFDPDQVSLTATKPGYKIAKLSSVTSSNKKSGTLEVDFVMTQEK